MNPRPDAPKKKAEKRPGVSSKKEIDEAKVGKVAASAKASGVSSTKEK